MTNVIQLLPERVANQIAAGEVVQRPASIVKELLENALDAGATEIKLIVRDAGKTLVQVVDNGCGMSETDARMCFERHATSKISEAKDLYAVKTMGFRGEAMPSIAAVAQVELRTRRAVDELGTLVVIEDSEIKTHEPCQAPPGTSISVKNLFFNVPARRNFLKSETVEMRHIHDEFQRIALANPDIFFSLHHNDQEVYHLPPSNLRQRIVKIFGEAVNKKLVPVKEETEMLKISGFVGNPDYYKKARGEQLFFVNKRFIKSNYLQHAVVNAYEELLPPDTYPLFVLFLEIDPANIDVNVHPTKQQIKFDDEKTVYKFLTVTVRHALGRHSAMPMLDFDQEPAFQPRPTQAPVLRPQGKSSVRDYDQSKKTDQLSSENLRHWQRLYEGLDLIDTKDTQQTQSKDAPATSSQPSILPSGASADLDSGNTGSQSNALPSELDDNSASFSKGQKEPYQIHGMYIVSQIKSGFLLIDQQAASERILYERYLEALRQQPVTTQKALFPKNIELPPADAAMLRDILPEVNRLGFDIAEFGGNAFIMHGAPADMGPGQKEEELLERLLTQYKNNLELELGVSENLARSMARSAALKRGQSLSVVEMQDMIDQLFACSAPYKSPNGRTCFITFELDELQKRFNR